MNISKLFLEDFGQGPYQFFPDNPFTLLFLTFISFFSLSAHILIIKFILKFNAERPIDVLLLFDQVTLKIKKSNDLKTSSLFLGNSISVRIGFMFISVDIAKQKNSNV